MEGGGECGSLWSNFLKECFVFIVFKVPVNLKWDNAWRKWYWEKNQCLENQTLHWWRYTECYRNCNMQFVWMLVFQTLIFLPLLVEQVLLCFHSLALIYSYIIMCKSRGSKEENYCQFFNLQNFMPFFFFFFHMLINLITEKIDLLNVNYFKLNIHI